MCNMSHRAYLPAGDLISPNTQFVSSHLLLYGAKRSTRFCRVEVYDQRSKRMSFGDGAERALTLRSKAASSVQQRHTAIAEYTTQHHLHIHSLDQNSHCKGMHGHTHTHTTQILNSAVACLYNRNACDGFSLPTIMMATDNYLLLMANTDKITDNFIVL